MKVSNKLHRILSMVAAILLLLSFISGSITTVVSWVNMTNNGYGGPVLTNILTYLIRSLATVFCIVVLFRGKKDSGAGAMMILAAGITFAMSVIRGVVSIISNIAMARMMDASVFGAVMCNSVFGLLGNVVTTIFYVLLAGEASKPGKFSTSKTKMMFFVLPVAMGVLSGLGTAIYQLLMMGAYASVAIGTAIGMLVGSLISHVPVLLQGIAFATPVYEETPACEEAPVCEETSDFEDSIDDYIYASGEARINSDN